MVAVRSTLLALLTGACTAPLGMLPPSLRDETPIAGDGAQILVTGLSCPQCATNIDLQLLRVAGVKQVSVDLGIGLVDVDFGPGPHPSRQVLAQAIVDSGFTVLTIDDK